MFVVDMVSVSACMVSRKAMCNCVKPTGLQLQPRHALLQLSWV